MSRTQSNMKRRCYAAVFTGILLLVLAGCSYTARPGIVPPVTENEGESFRGTSVLVTNAEKDASESTIPTETKGNSPFKANKRLWSQKLVESLARELARRGADVRATAPITLSVSVPEIVYRESREFIEFKTKATATLSSGWTKDYEGTASVESSKVYSPSQEADRLAGRTLAEIVKAVIGDPDFTSQLAKKQ